MNGTKETGKYEFSHAENTLLNDLSKWMLKLGISILVAGVLLIAYIIISYLEPTPALRVTDAKHLVLATLDYALWIVISLLVIYISVVLISLTVPLKLIAHTAGKDISHLMEFVKGLTRVCKLAFYSILIICILLMVSLVLMILVF